MGNGGAMEPLAFPSLSGYFTLVGTHTKWSTEIETQVLHRSLPYPWVLNRSVWI